MVLQDWVKASIRTVLAQVSPWSFWIVAVLPGRFSRSTGALMFVFSFTAVPLMPFCIAAADVMILKVEPGGYVCASARSRFGWSGSALSALAAWASAAVLCVASALGS